MKESILFLVLFLTINLNAQKIDNNINELSGLLEVRKFKKAIKLGEKLINGKFGELNTCNRGRVLFMLSHSYYFEKQIYESHDLTIDYLKFLKDYNDSCNTQLSDIAYKEKIIDNVNWANKMVNDFPSYNLMLVDKSEYIDIGDKVALNDKQLVNEKNNDKTVSLTVTGTGLTLEQATQNALRSAIEQAFGAFISINTEILNDELIRDEIVSISNGNIKEFKIISEVQMPDDSYNISLKATVSVTKLTSFAERKGISIDFKGALFAANIKQQLLNEEAEYLAILNLCKISNELLAKSLDFSIETSEPVKASGLIYFKPKEDDYQILLNVKITSNKNYESFLHFFLKTIRSISMSDEEVVNYKQINKKVFTLTIGNENIHLRNKLSSLIIQNLFIKSNRYLTDFKVITNIDTINVKKCCYDYNGGLLRTQNFYYGYDKPEYWHLNAKEADNYSSEGSKNGNYGFPIFTVKDDVGQWISNWRIYFEYLLWLRKNSILVKDNIYFTSTSHELIERGDPSHYNWPKYPYNFFPGIYQNIGHLELDSKYVTWHKYQAIYTLDELTKLTFIKVVPK